MVPINLQRNNFEKRPVITLRKVAGFFVILILVATGVLFLKGARTLTIVNANVEGFRVGTGYQNFVLEKEDTRMDILLMGIRGAGDPNGGLLADTILLVSYDTETGKSSIVSIPRDLYVDLPGHERKEKINTMYVVGEQQVSGGGGIALSKQILSYATGVFIDHAVMVNFEAFTDLIDMVGGVSITRNTAFREDQQWRFEGSEDSPYWHVEKNSEGEEGWVFEVPKGTSLLDSNTALYYVRSRYTTSDFDRMIRQQELLGALKDKILSLGVLTNPLRVYELLDIMQNNLETDMNVVDIRTYIELARKDPLQDIPSFVLDNSSEGLLVSDFQNEQFVLLPKAGHFNDIRDFFQTILE